MSLDGIADIASALQGEEFTDESMMWADELHQVELAFSEELHKREMQNDSRRSEEQLELENKLLARKLQVELDIGRRDATRDAVLLRAKASGNLLVAVSVMLSCAFMFVYQMQVPAAAPLPPVHNSSEFNFTLQVAAAAVTASGGNATGTVDENSLLDSAFEAQRRRYDEQRRNVAEPWSGGAPLLITYSLLLWLSIGLLACALWIGLLLHLRLKKFKVHVPLFRYECGHVHSVFGGYYKCRCLQFEKAQRRSFLSGTVSLIAAGCLSAWEVCIVSFGSVSAALWFIVPVALGLVSVLVLSFLLPEDTAHPDWLAEQRQRKETVALGARHKHGDEGDDENQSRGDKRHRTTRHHAHVAFEPIDGNATVHSPVASLRRAHFQNQPSPAAAAAAAAASIPANAQRRVMELSPCSVEAPHGANNNEDADNDHHHHHPHHDVPYAGDAGDDRSSMSTISEE